ncbi:MAG TPA: hypothetical protein VNJ02_09495 [Vicinamibacterales bacterium]|nr:hypothetical protein [Vicinamibacterales bacterium]
MIGYRLNVVAATMVFALAVALPSSAQDHQHDAHESDVGRVTFPSSCDSSAQPDIERAVAMLHSFWYDQAERSFAAIALPRPRQQVATLTAMYQALQGRDKYAPVQTYARDLLALAAKADSPRPEIADAKRIARGQR